MTLRDYFASHAPAMPENFLDTLAGEGTYVGDEMALSIWAFRYADAMLAERERGDK